MYFNIDFSDLKGFNRWGRDALKQEYWRLNGGGLLRKLFPLLRLAHFNTKSIYLIEKETRGGLCKWPHIFSNIYCSLKCGEWSSESSFSTSVACRHSLETAWSSMLILPLATDALNGFWRRPQTRRMCASFKDTDPKRQRLQPLRLAELFACLLRRLFWFV